MYMLGPNFHQLNRLDASTDEELGLMIRHVLRLLRPQRALGTSKVRVGGGHDGAYVMLDDLHGIDTALSFGINDNVEWDRAMADRGLTIHQFDHTVEDPAPTDPRMLFNKVMIGAQRGDDVETIESLVARHDRRQDRPNMILKMDIEGWEWAALEATSLDAVARFGQIICELHCFNFMRDIECRRTIFRGLRKLSKFYAPVHVHANNYAGWEIIAGVPVAGVVEVCFANRGLYRLEESTELFPTELDLPCNPDLADMWLGRFEY